MAIFVCVSSPPQAGRSGREEAGRWCRCSAFVNGGSRQLGINWGSPGDRSMRTRCNVSVEVSTDVDESLRGKERSRREMFNKIAPVYDQVLVAEDF